MGERSSQRLCKPQESQAGPNTHGEDYRPSTEATRPRRGINKRAKREAVGVERAIVVSDLHVPFHDPKAVELSIALVKDMRPEYLFFNGDVVDFYALSRFSKDPNRALALQDELDETVDILNAYRKASPDSKRIFIRGNHEARLQAYLHNKAPELCGLRGLHLPALLELERLDISYVAGRGKTACTRYGCVAIGHFDRVSAHSAFTAKALVDARSESLIQGHTHRLGIHYKTLPGGKMLGGFEGGCLCDMNPEYVTDPNWQQGVCVVTKRKDSDRFHIQQIAFVGGECLVNDVLYSS